MEATFRGGTKFGFSGEGRRRIEETPVAELERKIGRQAMEIDFLKGCLRQIEDLRRSQAETVNPLSAGKSTKNYRFDPEIAPAVQDVELRDRIQRIALRFPAYGRPRITAELKRQGWDVNHKRVGRIMREDNLLCLRKRKFHATTDSRHSFRIYPNLTRNFVPRAPNQLWVADITYIRLSEEFVYLAVVLDAYSRLVVGWAIERTLEAKLSIGALRIALKLRGASAGLTHHFDRGVQYACGEYTQLLAAQGIQVSMNRKGNPYDKAYASYCASSIRWGTISPDTARFDNLTPIAFRGGLSPGCSYKQALLLL